MQSQKFSISLPLEMVKFIEHYKNETGSPSRSQVISEALHLLQLQELEQAYREASLETDQAWETTVGDGLSHETWLHLLHAFAGMPSALYLCLQFNW